ncbi:MAG TPA: hypothetical protein VKK79_18980 [Candidatus Lokiarchaeia archaeon]|nr:hypothetical protein [Candidatus Lokiarchaeia archaeon]
MFDADKAELDALFNFYLKRFGEDIGMMLGVIDTEDIELDLYVGEKSNLVRGMRVFQLLDVEHKEEEESGEEDSEEEDDDKPADVIVYDLVATPGAEVSGQRFFNGALGKPDSFIEGEEEENAEAKEEEEPPTETPEDVWITLSIYSVDGGIESDITCAVITYGPDLSDETVFVEDPEFD